MYNSFHPNEVVGDLPFYWSDISIVVTDKRVNRGIGLGMEIPAD